MRPWPRRRRFAFFPLSVRLWAATTYSGIFHSVGKGWHYTNRLVTEVSSWMLRMALARRSAIETTTILSIRFSGARGMEKIVVLSIADLLAKAIRNIHEETSVTSL